MANNPNITYLDLNSRLLEIGQQVSVQHCIGSYGQCRTATGELLEVDEWSGIRIRLSHSYIQNSGKFGSRDLVAGDEAYIASVFTYRGGIMTGYRKCEDYEHGHEVWIKIIDEDDNQGTGKVSQ
jgi:hypothetical protein